MPRICLRGYRRSGHLRRLCERSGDVVALVPLVLTSAPYKTSHYSHLPVCSAILATAAIRVLLFPFFVFFHKTFLFFSFILFLFGNCESFGWCRCMNANGSRVRSISGNFVILFAEYASFCVEPKVANALTSWQFSHWKLTATWNVVKTIPK